MLRLLTGALLVANLLYFGWSLGWLDAVVGFRATGDREPDRMARQFRPELVKLEAPGEGRAPVAEASRPSPPAASAAASSPAPAPPASAAAPTAVAVASTPGAAASAKPPQPGASAASSGPAGCIEAGPFAASDLAAAETMMKSAWPGGQWTRRRVEGATEWMIYMGPYPDDESLERKKGELARIRGGLPYEVMTAPAQLANGISLGRFKTQADAEQRMGELRLRGIRTARIVNQGAGPAATMLRVANGDTTAAARLAAVKWPSGKTGVTPCPAPP